MTVEEIKDFLADAGVDDFMEIDKFVRKIKSEKKDEFRLAKIRQEEFIKEEKKKELEPLKEGDKVKILFKGEEQIVKFVKITEQRFTVEIEDGIKRSIMFDKLISIE